MTAVTPTRDSASRYRIEPTVMQALRSPRLLTREVLAGLVVALALIPEAIAFSIIAGVDPESACSRPSSWPSRSRSSADALP